MDATCTIQDSIHVFSLVHKYVSRILGTYQYEQWFWTHIYLTFLIYISNELKRAALCSLIRIFD